MQDNYPCLLQAQQPFFPAGVNQLEPRGLFFTESRRATFALSNILLCMKKLLPLPLQVAVLTITAQNVKAATTIYCFKNRILFSNTVAGTPTKNVCFNRAPAFLTAGALASSPRTKSLMATINHPSTHCVVPTPRIPVFFSTLFPIF